MAHHQRNVRQTGGVVLQPTDNIKEMLIICCTHSGSLAPKYCG